MASSSSSTASFAANERWTYDVFVSFRGADIRKGFIDHLFTDFRRKGIFPFRDDKRINCGDEISPALSNAINKSRMLVVIFSKNYATSSWCLDELVDILRCNDMGKDEHQVRVIFYGVNKEVVRNHSHSYEEALKKHVAKGVKEVPQWMDALSKAADLPGWDLHHGYESKFIDEISKDIFNILSYHGPLDAGENLVGLDCRAKQMDLLRFVEPDHKVHMVGICGISGVGKTTIAKALYNLLHIHFDGFSFCEDVRRVAKMRGLPYLQKQLLDDITDVGGLKIHSVGQGISVIKERLRSKRVLIVLDDVSHRDQFKALVGNRNWFGPGSLIIVTCKDRQLLSAHGVEEIFEAQLLDQEESLELFSYYAFRGNEPKEDFIELSYSVINYVDGHPLALKILGGFLFGKDVHIWESEVAKLKSHPNFEIQRVLRLSYDGLDSNQQDIFLDIACFFRSEKPDFVKKMLDACHLYADTDIRVLMDRSFVAISSRGGFQLHDLIKTMGHQVVREESDHPGKRSRLWSQKDGRRVLNSGSGSQTVQGLTLTLTSCPKVQIGSKSLEKMNMLRIFKVYYNPLEEPENGKYYRNIIFALTKMDHSERLDFVSNELRWLCWHGFPFEYVPSTFHPENLVALNLSYGNIKQLWTETRDFPKLTTVELKYCEQLIETPDFTQMPNLEELYLESCTNLVRLHPSVGCLKKLTVLNLENCKNLRSFPSTIDLESLQILNLSGCSKLDNLPEDLGNSKNLLELHADGTAIAELPLSIKFLNKLQVLSLGGHKGIPRRSWKSMLSTLFSQRKSEYSSALALPSLSGLSLIKNLDVSHMNLSVASLNEISCLTLLEELNLSGNNFESIPESFGRLSGLRRLGLVGCNNLKRLPELPSTLDTIDAQNCTNLQELPSTIYESKHLRFDFSNCSKLAENQTIESLASILLPQRRVDPYTDVNLFFPGSRVPEWFTHRNEGDRVRLDLPQSLAHHKLKGFAACAVFSPIHPKGGKRSWIDVFYNVESFDGAFLGGIGVSTDFFPSEIRRYESDQVWLTFMVPEGEIRWEDAKEYIEVSFEIYGICCQVKECGVRLIYEEKKKEEEENDDDDDDGVAQSKSEMIEWLPHAADHNTENVISIFHSKRNEEGEEKNGDWLDPEWTERARVVISELRAENKRLKNKLERKQAKIIKMKLKKSVLLKDGFERERRETLCIWWAICTSILLLVSLSYFVLIEKYQRQP